MSSFKPAARVARIKPSPSSQAATRAQELKASGVDIIDLTVGEPDFDTPANVSEAGIAAIRAGKTRYTPVNGALALRQAIIATARRRSGIDYGPEHLSIGGGAKQVIFVALMAAVDAGDEVIIPAPYWVSYPDMVLANDGVPVTIACPQSEGFKLTPQRLEAAITPATRWLILNSPSNPTGAVYSAAELRGLAAVLAKHPQVWVLTDDIYDTVWFGEGAIASLAEVAPELRDRILSVNGVSKSHAMTGWRLGYGLGPAPLIKAMNTLQSQMSSCPSSISQAAAVEALTGDQSFVEKGAAVYRRRRDLALSILEEIPGLTTTVSEGAFYLFPNCAGMIGKSRPDGRRIESDLDFVLYLLDEGVAAIHGSAYGLSPHFRISIATADELIETACRRIADACAKLR